MWTVLGDFAYRLIHVCCLMQSWICILIGVQGSSDALFCDLPISWSHVSSFNHSFSSFHPNSTQSWSKPGFSLESQAGSGCCVVVPVHPSHLLQLARRTFRWCWSWLFMKWDFFKICIFKYHPINVTANLLCWMLSSLPACTCGPDWKHLPGNWHVLFIERFEERQRELWGDLVWTLRFCWCSSTY